MLRIIDISQAGELLSRNNSRLDSAIETVKPIIDDVRLRGDTALFEYAKKFDDFNGSSFAVKTGGKLSPELLNAVEVAATNIRAFSQSQLPKDKYFTSPDGRSVGQVVRAIDSVGVYVPAGSYPLISTLMMAVIPAQIAGVKSITVVCPKPSSEMLALATWLGIEHIMQIGGAQAIAALAYGSESISRVTRIVGPGNAFVAAAKKLVSVDTAIDFVAGPSEIAIVAQTGNPKWIAADMLAQCEHDVNASALLLTCSNELALAVQLEVAQQLESLSTRKIAEQSIKNNSAVILCPTIDQAFEFINTLAPEHLSIEEQMWLDKVRNAGSVFIGSYSTEAAGDYASGPNHILPTSGLASLRGGLSSADFVKVISVQQLSSQALKNLAPSVTTLARAEGLEAHARSIEVRLISQSKSAVVSDSTGLQPNSAVQNMRPYSPPSQGRADKMRLDFNENTVGCSPQVIDAICRLTDSNMISMYPEYSQAQNKIAKHFGVNTEQMVFTNGTDEAISLLVNTFIEPGGELIVMHPSYAMYRFYGELGSAKIVEVDYDAKQQLVFDLEELLAKINQNTAAIFLANPNNPTGTAISRGEIIKILDAAPHAVVLIDEAYVEFADVSVLDLISEYANLVVSRTFSKAYGMAGIRFGCMFSKSENIAWVRKAQSPYSVNAVAVVAACAAVDDSEYLANYVSEVRECRSFVEAEFDRLGIKYFKSSGNFLLFDVGHRAKEIRDQLAMSRVLIRDRSYEISGCLRVTIGTKKQMSVFIQELERVL
ncbi:MAG: histidinol dehydrogenase [Actinomycetota bacterium]